MSAVCNESASLLYSLESPGTTESTSISDAIVGWGRLAAAGEIGGIDSSICTVVVLAIVDCSLPGDPRLGTDPLTNAVERNAIDQAR